MGPDGKRLSKRHGAQAVEAYEEEGIFPDAMVNFLALLGWSPGTDEELMSKRDLITGFSLERVLKKGSVFDAAKLRWLNGRYMVRMETGELAKALQRRLNDGDEAARRPCELSHEAFLRMTELLAPRSRTLSEMAAMAAPYVGPVRAYDAKAARKTWKREPEHAVQRLSAVARVLDRVTWEAAPLEEALRGLGQQVGCWGREGVSASAAGSDGPRGEPGYLRCSADFGA